jgi:hypothetical protein
MSKWQDVVDRLVRTVQIPLHTHHVNVENWPSANEDGRLHRSFRDQQSVYFWLQTGAKTITCLQAPFAQVSEKEEQLILLLLEQAGVVEAGLKSTTTQIGKILYEYIINGRQADPTIEESVQSPLSGVAMLLWNRHDSTINHDEIIRILNSFLSSNNYQFYPFPVGAGLLLVSREEVEEAGESFGFAVQEVILSESGVEVDVAVNSFERTKNTLIGITEELYETLQLGRKFQPNQFVHFPQTLQLEQIIHQLPTAFVENFVQQSVLRLADSEGEEIWGTLETYFETNQNISETAKQLFIHRNTLLYRFERFKQMTGYDVRVFQDAVLIKLYLLLVKVTKASQ